LQEEILMAMQKVGKIVGLVTVWLSFSISSFAQCSICTKTAQQLGKESATGLNNGIIYLMMLPFAIGGFIAYRWWKQEKQIES
jgi:hypothetical protein